VPNDTHSVLTLNLKPADFPRISTISARLGKANANDYGIGIDEKYRKEDALRDLHMCFFLVTGMACRLHYGLTLRVPFLDLVYEPVPVPSISITRDSVPPS